MFFFFSSRRRHTRWPRDWSSDVCSSDLHRRGASSLRDRTPWIAAGLAHRHGGGRPGRRARRTALAMRRAVAIDLDGALGDTRPLWDEFLADAARRFGSIAALDPASLPRDRGAAAEELDAWAAGGVGDWRAALERF